MKNDKLEHDDDSVATRDEEEVESDEEEEKSDDDSTRMEEESDDDSTRMEEEEETDDLSDALAIKTVADDPTDNNVIKTWSDITGIRYYNGDHIVKTKRDLDKLIASNQRNPAKGVPEKLFWVAFKRGAKGTDQQVPWTTVVHDGKERHLDKWINERSKRAPQKDREGLFPSEAEEHAISVYTNMREMEDLPELRKIAAILHKEWTDLGFGLH